MRRLAAVDMHALSGTDLRRRVIIAEFVGAVIVGVAIALWLLLSTDETIGTLIAIYVLGIAANYVPLAGHALSLRSRERLERELVGVDLPAELRYYTRAQFLVFVPLLFVWFELSRRGR